MIIEYFGHSCFKIRDDERSIVFDPFGKIGYELPMLVADYCVCSHEHYDHYAFDRVAGAVLVTDKNAAEFPFLRAVETRHDECGGRKRGKNAVFVYRSSDGLTFCHMGDIGEPITDELAEKIGKIDVLAIPVGGNYTIDAEEALRYVEKLKPKTVIPMHYKTRRSNVDIDGKEKFLALFGGDRIKTAACKIELESVGGDSSADKLIENVIDFDDYAF